MKLFKVTIEYDYVVVAKNAIDARDVASRYVHESLSDCFDSSDFRITEYTPGSVDYWTGDLEPYGGHKTTDEYLKDRE